MKQGRPIGLLLIGAFAAMVGTMAHAADDRADSTSVLSLDAGLGFSDHQREVREQCWYPLRVTIKAVRSDVEGMVTIRQIDNPMVIEIPVSVAKGTTKRYEMPYRPTNERGGQHPVKVALRARKLGEDSLLLPLQFLDNDDRTVLVVADDPTGFAFLSIRHRQDSPAAGMIPQQGLTYGAPEFLPDDPLLYESLTLIVISTSKLREIQPAQWEAILAWVEHGGRLLIAVGHYQPFYSQSDLPKLTGRNFSTVTPLEFGGGDASVVAFEAPRSEPEFELSPEADRLFSVGQSDVIFGESHGRGWLGFSTVALDRPVLDAINGHPQGRRAWIELAGHTPTQSTGLNFVNRNEGALGMLLQMPFLANLSGVGWVFRFAGIYILLAVPLNWLVWSRFKRREWAWPTALVLAVGFSFYAYSTGAGRGGSYSRTHRLTLISRPAESATVRTTKLDMIYSPRRIRETMTVGGGIGLPSAVRDYASPYPQRNAPNPYSGQEILLKGPTPLTLEDFVVYPSSARGLRLDAITKSLDTPKVEARLSHTPSEFKPEESLSGTLANNTPFTFEKWFLLSRGHAWLGNTQIQPGTEIAIHPSELHQTDNLASQMAADLCSRFRPHQAVSEKNTSNYLDYYLNEISGGLSADSLTQLAKSTQIRFIGLARRMAAGQDPDIATEAIEEYVIYEQDIPMANAESATDAPSIRWKLDFADAASSLAATRQWEWHYAKREGGLAPDALIVIPQEQVLRIGTDGAFNPEGVSRLSLHLRVDSIPANAPPMIKGSDRYRVAGCPVALFDFHAEAWKPMGDFTGAPIVLDSLERFVEPATRCMLIRLDADPARLLLAKLNEAGEIIEVEPNEKVWGDYFPQNVFQVSLPKVEIEHTDAPAEKGP